MDLKVPDFNQLKDRAILLLARRDHSIQELRSKLRQRLKFDETLFSEVVSYLKELGYLVPPEELAARWVKHWRAQGRGRHWINGKLRTKGLPSPRLEDEDEIESVRNFIERKLGATKPKSQAK